MLSTRIALHCAALVGVSVVAVALPANASAPDLATQKKIAAMSVPFVANAGQWNARAAFAAQTFAGTLFVTKQGELVYSLPGKPLGAGTESVGADSAALGSREATPSRRLPKPSERSPGWALTETLVDSKGHVRPMHESTLKAPAGYRPMEGKVSYAIGNDAAKHTNNLNTYERVNLGDMYPGINVQLRATGSNVEKIFTVAPQQDPKQINIAVAGADKLEIGDSGELIAVTGNGPVTFTAPIAFQENAAGERVAVAVSYALNANGQRYGFTLGEYDRAQALVIDPLLQSTYFGGSATDAANAIAIHPTTGDVYIAGDTTSTDLPGSAGGAQTEFAEAGDGFVVRFNAALTARLQTTYFGGNGTDRINAIAIHPVSGDVYVAGSTDSSDLPGRLGGAQFEISSGTDGFVARINAGLTAVVQSTYFGGTGADTVSGMAIHPESGEIVIVGRTGSPSLPALGGAAQTVDPGSDDAFVARLNTSLTQILRSTFHGGESSDFAQAVAVHPITGEIYVVGYTQSNNFPQTQGGAQPARNGPTGHGFISRLNAELSQHLRSSYFGGLDGNSDATAVAIHPISGEVYMAGYTRIVGLPAAMGGAQAVIGGTSDGYVTRFDAALTRHEQSTYIGGQLGEEATALSIHPTSGEVYVSGLTSSDDLPAVTNGAQSSPSGNSNSFVTRFNSALTKMLQSSYLGGSAYDEPKVHAIHPTSGHVYVAGFTLASDFPGVSGGSQSTLPGTSSAFVSRLSADLSANDQTPSPFAFVPQLGVPRSSVRTSNPVLIAGIVGAVPLYVDGASGSSYCISSANNCSCDVSLGFVSTLGLITNNNYVCVRHMSSGGLNVPTQTVLHVGTELATFSASTGTAFTGACSLDIDGSGGPPNAATDGLMLVRALLGFTGTAVTNGAISGTPPRNTWPLIRDYLNQNCGANFAP